MTREEKRVAIAKACGWKFGGPGDALRNPKGQLVNAHYSESWRLPDYFNDLNAMHEAIMAKPAEIRGKINCTLMEMLRPNDSYILDRTINATAAQRAEAFGLTLKLWEAE